MIQIGMCLGYGLGMTRIGMQRLGTMRMMTGRPGTRDDKENEIILYNIQDIREEERKGKWHPGN
jgi:hypothetical protein